MVTINDLPKIIEISDEQYNLSLHITAWNKVCVSYKSIKDSLNPYILSSVVEEDKMINIPNDGLYSTIVDAPTLDIAIIILYARVYELFNKGYLTIIKK